MSYRQTTVFLLFVLFVSCYANKKNGVIDKPVVITAEEAEKGLELIGNSDCTTCHKISETNIGPSYTDMAKKYEVTRANIDTLAYRTIKGGTGVWGQIPMTPHPNLSLDDARLMMKFILSLRNK